MNVLSPSLVLICAGCAPVSISVYTALTETPGCLSVSETSSQHLCSTHSRACQCAGAAASPQTEAAQVGRVWHCAIQNILGTQLFRTGLLPPLWLYTGKPAFLGRKATAYLGYLCSFTLLKCIYYHCTITVLLLQYGKESNWKKSFALNPSSAKNTKPKIKIKQNDNNKNHKKKPHQKNQKAERSNNCPELPCLKLAWITGELLSISFPFLLRKHWNKRKLSHMGVQLLCSSESAQHPLRNNIMAWRSVQARAWNWH